MKCNCSALHQASSVVPSRALFFRGIEIIFFHQDTLSPCHTSFKGRITSTLCLILHIPVIFPWLIWMLIWEMLQMFLHQQQPGPCKHAQLNGTIVRSGEWSPTDKFMIKFNPRNWVVINVIKGHTTLLTFNGVLSRSINPEQTLLCV